MSLQVSSRVPYPREGSMTMTAIGLSLAGKTTSKTCGIAETTWNNLKISFVREAGSGLLQSSPLPRDEVTVCSSSGWPQVIFSGQRNSAPAGGYLCFYRRDRVFTAQDSPVKPLASRSCTGSSLALSRFRPARPSDGRAGVIRSWDL